MVWNHSSRPVPTALDQLLLLLRQILEYEQTPAVTVCVHQRATFVELSEFDGCEPELFRQINHGSERVIVVARKKDDAVPSLDLRIGCQLGRTQVIKALNEL